MAKSSERVGRLFGELILKKYPPLRDQQIVEVSLDDLLTWSYWPNFIKIWREFTAALMYIRIRMYMCLDYHVPCCSF